MREQPWMRHVAHQMTTLIFGHKDACKSRLVLNLSQAERIECAVRAVLILFCTNVSCEWVSCLQEEFSKQQTETLCLLKVHHLMH